MALAIEKGFQSMAFPLIKVESGGFNQDRAKAIMEDRLGKLEHSLEMRIVVRQEEKVTPPMGKHNWRDLLCPKCHQLRSTCSCRSEPTAPSRSTVVRVGRETKGRRGKGVTIISDLPLDETCLTELAAKLKTRLGTGGTVKDGRIEVQGDHRERIVVELEGLGYRVKRAGG
jgi:translation initiation factor 1